MNVAKAAAAGVALVGVALVALVATRRGGSPVISKESETKPRARVEGAASATAAGSAVPQDPLDLLRERVTSLERRLADLKGRKEDLLAQKAALEERRRKEGEAEYERNAQASARAGAEDTVRDWERPLKLSRSQSDALKELWTRWERENYNRRVTVEEWPAERQRWRIREEELRVLLSGEQAALLNRHLKKYASYSWSHLAESFSAMAGMTGSDVRRLREAIGGLPLVPDTALLPEPNGLDSWSLKSEALRRSESLLTAEQRERVLRFIGRPGWSRYKVGWD